MTTRRRRTANTESITETNTIKRQDFLDALSKVKPGLAKKEIVEQSTHFIFDKDRIWTYNDQIHICQKFDSGLSGAVMADHFYKLLEKLPGDELSIAAKEGKIVLSIGDKIKSNIKIDPDIKIQPIQIPAINSQKWEELPKNFHEAIVFSAFSASRNMIRPELCCIYVARGFAIGCDTFRGTRYILDSELKQEFLIPATAAAQLSKYNPYKVLYENGWLHFINKEKTTFSCRTIEEEYPEQIWHFFDVEGEEVKLPQDFLDAVGRAQVMITADFDLDQTVTLTMENNQVVCFSEGDYGDFYEKADIEYDGPKLEIKVHPTFLKEILKHLQTVIVGERLLFKSESFEHGICLSC